MTHHDINHKLYDLLKDILGLHENCMAFTLEVNFENYPVVTQEYLIRGEKKTQQDEIND